MLELFIACTGNRFHGIKPTKEKEFCCIEQAEWSWRFEEHFDNRYGDVEFGDSSSGFGLI